MLELQLEIQLEGQISLEIEIQNTEIVVVEGFDYFDIDWINPTLSDGTLTADFAFSPSPQEDVTKIELWINGALSETRESNDESPFVVEDVNGAAEVLIKAYNNDLLMQESQPFQLPIPIAPDFIDFSFSSSKTIDVIAECSDPQNLDIAIKYLGIPTNGLVSILDDELISVQEIDRENPTLIPYVIENSAGVIDSGNITFNWEEISISIDTPTQNQEIPSDEDVTVAFTVTPAQQDYISAIALVVDGVEVEKRTPYSGDDFVIDAGELTEDTHTLRIRAYDLDDVQVFETGVRSFEVVGSGLDFGNGLLTDAVDDRAIGSFTAIQGATKVTISVWANFNANSEGPAISLFGDSNNRFEMVGRNGFVFLNNRFGVNFNQRNIEISEIGSGIHHLMFVFDGTLSVENSIKLYVDGVLATLNTTNNDNIGFISNSITSLRLGMIATIYEDSLQTEVAIDVGRSATAQNAVDLYNNGLGADYRFVVGDPTAYYKTNEVEPATTLSDEMGYVDLTLENFSSPYLVNFQNYTP